MRLLLGMVIALAATCPLIAQDAIPFEVQFLAVDSNEGCDVGDLDGDGKLDVIAGRYWFRNGDWVARPVRLIEDWNGYVDSNGDFLWDVNGDGHLDVIAGAFGPTVVHWFENPGPEGLQRGLLWNKHVLQDTGYSSNEASFMRDIDGDGTPEWITNSWNRDNPVLVWQLKNKKNDDGSESPTLIPHVIGKVTNGHGMGFGDVNNDGREDILVGSGWYERPEGDPFAKEWTFHKDWERALSCPVLVRDLNGDGKNDVIWGNPHDFGLYVWFSEGWDDDGKWQYREELADNTYSQLHAIEFFDLDGDGQDELVTGKRVRAHNGNDPGGQDPSTVCYYTWDKDAKKFERHQIHRGEVGIGLQIRAADLDGDGDLEIVVAGKDGTQILWNRGEKGKASE